MMVKRFPTPIFKPFWPFFVAGAVVYYGAYKFTAKAMNSDEYINDPRNPRFVKGGKPVEIKPKEI